MALLIFHPDTPAQYVSKISVDLSRACNETIEARYLVVCDLKQLLLDDISVGERRDGLWKTTCFELFVECEPGYFEFNFSPATHWNAYAFSSYRNGMRWLGDVDVPEIDQDGGSNWYEFEVRMMLPSAIVDGARIGLSAVIEETDGTKSYWALRHPPGPPDFHHPDCFALTLPAPE